MQHGGQNTQYSSPPVLSVASGAPNLKAMPPAPTGSLLSAAARSEQSHTTLKEKTFLLKAENLILSMERQRLQKENSDLQNELVNADEKYQETKEKFEPEGQTQKGFAKVTDEEGPVDTKQEESSPTTKRRSSLQGGPPGFAVTENTAVTEKSAMKLPASLQGLIYLTAAGFVIFTLLAPAYGIGAADDSHGSAAEGSAADSHGSASPLHGSASDSHGSPSDSHGSVIDDLGGPPPSRRLGGGGGGPSVITNIAYCMVGAGLLSFLMHLMKQPLLLGYILGGVLVGPTGLQLVNTAEEIDTITELGLILLLFMIGLELDASELFQMFKHEKAVLVTGVCALPICALLHGGFFAAFAAAGASWGEGEFAGAYFSICCAISSTMIVVRMLKEKMETDTTAGRLTIGVLMCEDLWAMFMLAVQPNLQDLSQSVEVIKTLGLIGLLIIISILYAKYVLPTALASAAESIELMLVLSLTWCFFICALAMLPFVQISMVTAAFIAGVSMATFPYSSEFNGKLKYIRDFFVTLYFCGLGMQIPAPTSDAVGKAFLATLVVVGVRWIGVFGLIFACGCGQRTAVLPTLNLSQISEFSLVICSLGKSYGHVQQDTFTILIWTFTFLAVTCQYVITYNHELHKLIAPWLNKANLYSHSESRKNLKAHLEHEEERDIILLGFYKLASCLIAEFESHCPQILHKIHVIDVNTALAPRLELKGIAFSYGDISNRKEVESTHRGRVSLVVCSIPDAFLRGCTNLDLLMNTRLTWPNAHVIVCADTEQQTADLYNSGAAYVLNRVRLGAERLSSLIFEHETVVGGGGQIRDLMRNNQALDAEKERRVSHVMAW